jgi:phosphocarrier protein FPr
LVSIVLVSHSAALAEGVAELAREMGGEEVAIAAAGGLDDGAIGTDAARVMAAVEEVRSPDGVLVLMDLGSALMSTEMALEMLDQDGGPVTMSAAPLVEGAVAAAARARGGADLGEVAREARGALAMKTSQLGEEEPAAAEAAPAVAGDGALEGRFAVENRLGLHARPAGRIVSALGGLDAQVTLESGGRTADARSLTAIAVLAVRRGGELTARAGGPDAQRALDALAALAAANWGDDEEEQAPPAPAQEEREPAPADIGDRLRGAAASPGIALGPARRLETVEPEVAETPSGSPAEERARLAAARDAVREDLAAAGRALSGPEAEIFDAHRMLLDDAALVTPAEQRIADGAAAGAAWRDAAREAAAAFRGLDDAYLRERAVDVEDVARRVLSRLAGVHGGALLREPGIVLADELTPGEAAALDPERAFGLVTARGGATGHAAIVARALGIPAVIGAGPDVLAIADGTPLALDGGAGVVDIDPGAQAVADYAARRDTEAAARAEALAAAAAPATLADGTRIEVFANLGAPGEAANAVAQGAEGVGLLRTEFLFLDRGTAPTEDEQVELLTALATGMEGRPVVVRTLDAGADKPLPFLRQATEDNPFLGVRGIRLSLRERELFRTQLRAILRVAERHPIAVMFPMVATLQEFRAARALLEEERIALGAAARPEVGVMVEVPALALAADAFAREVDFFSVGTNDLSQYAMAAERGNAAVADLLEAARPSVLALIAQVVAAATAHERWVGVCGELAGDPEAAVQLAGLGVRELSMAPGRIPAVKAALRAVDRSAASAAAAAALPGGAR